MNATQTLQALLDLPLDATARQAIRWELYWYKTTNTDPAFVEDSKRETLPLKLNIAPTLLAILRERLPVENVQEDTWLLKLEDSGRQPEIIYLDTKIPPIIPAGVEATTDAISAVSPVPLKTALLLARLSSRYPQLRIEATLQSWSSKDCENVSQPFRRTIFRGIILGRKPSAGLRLLDRFGLLDFFLPEITAGKGLSQNRFHAYDIYEHLLRSVDAALDLNEAVRWAALLHDIGKVPTRIETDTGEATFHNHELFSARMVVPIMKRLAVPIAVGKKVKFLVRNHMFHYTDEWTDRAVRRFVRKVPLEELQDLIALRLADRKGSGKKTAFPKALQKLIDHIDEIIAKEKEFKIKDLAVNGHTLMELGIPPSRQMGDILKFLHAEVKAGRVANEAESLIALVREKMAEFRIGKC